MSTTGHTDFKRVYYKTVQPEKQFSLNICIFYLFLFLNLYTNVSGNAYQKMCIKFSKETDVEGLGHGSAEGVLSWVEHSSWV